MGTEVRIASWNVNGETSVSGSQLQAQLSFLADHAPDLDIIFLQAVRNQETHDDEWDTHLATLINFFEQKLAYHVVHTGDWARELDESEVQPHEGLNHNRCNLTASRWPIDRRPLSLRNVGNRKPRKLNNYYSHFPEKILVTDIDVSNDESLSYDRIETWNVGIVNGAHWGEEKVNMLETVYRRIYLQNTKMGHPLVLGGDFNAPQKETVDRTIVPHSGPDYTNYPGYGNPRRITDDDGTAEYTFGHRWRRAEQQLFDNNLSQWDMQDAYLALPDSEYQPSTTEYTHIIHNGNPSKKRLDHVLVSGHFDVTNCGIWNGLGTTPNGLRGNGSYKSDHAPVVAEVSLEV